MYTRRHFLKHSSITAFGLALSNVLNATTAGEKHILLRNGWQVENIGDIAHTPGMLQLIKEYMPKAKVTFWPHYHVLPVEEVAMLNRDFPDLKIVEGVLDAAGNVHVEVAKVMDTADYFLHGSGPATIGWAEALAFKKLTGKPYGVYGVTYGLYGTPENEMLNGAAFVYFRDTVSLELAKKSGIHAPIMGFAPDAAFAYKGKNDKKAKAFLEANNLVKGQFLCCIPKHRATPVWLYPYKGSPFDKARSDRNEAMMEHDLKVLIVAEDLTQTELGKIEVWDKLPKDVQQQTIWRSEFWLPDEALSIYRQSRGLFSLEMHSPIMCIGNGVPALVARWQEQSSKGIMWRDIGLGDWLFDFDNEEELQKFAPKVLEMAKNPTQFKKMAQAAQKRVIEFQKNTMSFLKKSV